MKPVDTASCDASDGQLEPPSLRSNFVWAFAGNATYAACQWGILSLIAKLGDQEMLGIYALALAVSTPVGMLSHMNLRAVLATDAKRTHPFGDYLAVCLRATAAGLAAIAAIAVAAGYDWRRAAIVFAIGVSLNSENISDLHYGLLQRREQMDQIARSMMLRGLLSVVGVGAALWLTQDLMAAVIALALSRILILIAYDRPRAAAGEVLSRSDNRAAGKIFRTALPLGLVLMLASLNTNLPRYAIEHFSGTTALGAFAAVASFIRVGSTMTNAMGQTAIPRLARHFSEADAASFRRLSLQLTGLALILGAAGVAVAAVAGELALTIVFRPEYAVYQPLLVALMAAAALVYVASALGFVLTGARSFVEQLPLLCAVAAGSAIASWVLVPVMGLYGAPVALGISALVQICGSLIILRRAWYKMESTT